MIKEDITLKPGNVAVLFASERERDMPDYDAMDKATMEVVESLPGFMGYEIVRNGNHALFMSYWEDKEAVGRWSRHPLHLEAKEKGQAVWYDAYRSVVSVIVHASVFRRVAP